MANVTFGVHKTPTGNLILQAPELTGDTTVVFPLNGGTIITSVSNTLDAPVTVCGYGAHPGDGTVDYNILINSYGNTNDFIQQNIQNLNSGSSASCDMVVTCDDGDNYSNFGDFGINSSTYSSGEFGLSQPRDVYLFSYSTRLTIGTCEPGKNIIFHSGGKLSADIRFVITDNYSYVNRKGAEARLGGVLWTKISPTSLASWTSATSCIGADNTGVGYGKTLPADFFAVGRTVEIECDGTMSSATSTPTMNWTLTLGGTTICSTGARSILNNSSTFGVHIKATLTCVAVGSTATIIGNIKIMFTDQTNTMWLYTAIATTAVNINTASSQAIDITVACGTSNVNNTHKIYQTTIKMVG